MRTDYWTEIFADEGGYRVNLMKRVPTSRYGDAMRIDTAWAPLYSQAAAIGECMLKGELRAAAEVTG